MFFKLICTPDFFCVQHAAFKATSSISNMFWHHLLFFGHLPNCLESYMTVKLKISTKWILKMLKLGMVSSYHPHSMREKSREGHGKNWMHFVYKLDNLFRSIRVSDENSSVTPAIQNFNNLLQLRTFFAFNRRHSKPRHQLSTLSDIICYFSCIYWFVLR